MRISYRGAVALGQLLCVPALTPPNIRKKWIAAIKEHLRLVKLTPRKRARLVGLLRAAKSHEKKIMYSAGMYNDKGVPAKRFGKRVYTVPFGTWYFVSKSRS
jgi:hypothetical protein